MPTPKIQTAPVVRGTDTIIHAVHGEIIATLSAEEMTVHHPDGRVELRKTHSNLMLADGTNFSVSMLLGTPPQVELGVCEMCRHPPYAFPVRDRPTHGLIRLSRAKTCSCGTLCCRKHRRLCSDGIVRCQRCARSFRWKEAILGILFSRRSSR